MEGKRLDSHFHGNDKKVEVGMTERSAGMTEGGNLFEKIYIKIF